MKRHSLFCAQLIRRFIHKAGRRSFLHKTGGGVGECGVAVALLPETGGGDAKTEVGKIEGQKSGKGEKLFSRRKALATLDLSQV